MAGKLLLKRLIAFVLDWYFASVVLNLGSRVLAISLSVGGENGQVINYTSTYLLLEMLLCLVVSFVYFVLIPFLLKKAQTPMMALLGLQIVTIQTNKPSLFTLVKRFYLGSFLLQGYLNSQFSLFLFNWRRLLANYDTQLLANFFVIVSGVSLIISAYIAAKSDDFSRSLQDYLADTQVRTV